MKTFKIGPGKTESVPAGTYSDAVFRGIEEFESNKGEKLLRWKFEINGVQVNSISGQTDPTVTNKFGKYLCGISGQPLAVGTEIGDPNDYIGRRYFVVVVANEKGSQVDMFTQVG